GGWAAAFPLALWSPPPRLHHTTVLLPPCPSPERVGQRLDQRELRHQVAARDRLHAARLAERAKQTERDDEPADPGDEKDEREVGNQAQVPPEQSELRGDDGREPASDHRAQEPA